MQSPDVIGLLLNAGLAGIMLVLFLRGWIVPKPSADRLAKESDQWRKFYEQERAAHETTRRAHAEEIKAALQAAAEGSQIAAALLSELKGRREAKT